MAVQTGQTQGQASSFATNTGAAGQASETLNSSSTGGNGGLFDFTQGLHSLPVSATVGGQSIRDFQKVWDEMQKADTAWDMVLLNLDRTNEPGWFASAIELWSGPRKKLLAATATPSRSLCTPCCWQTLKSVSCLPSWSRSTISSTP